MERRLSAVVAADAIAFSRRLALADEQTVSDVIECRRLMQRAAATQEGRVVSTPGDFILAEFPSATQAIFAALDFVGAVADRPHTESSTPLRYRVGIGLGEVFEVDGDLLGTAVNQAARLQQIAKPDQVLVSGPVRDIVQHNAGTVFRALGTFRLKNLPKRVRVFEVSRRLADSSGAAEIRVDPKSPLAGPPGPAWHAPSLVVGPFRALGDNRTMAAGLTQVLIASLGVLTPAIGVFEHDPLAGKGLIYRLTGTIEGADHARITANLVEAWTGRAVWSNRYELASFRHDTIESAVIRDVVAAIQITLTEGEQARLWHGSTRSLAAWESFQRGKDLERMTRPESHRRARRFYTHALEQDPDYLAAIVALGFCHLDEARLGWTDDVATPLAAAAGFAARAARIDPDYAELQALQGFLAMMAGRHDEAVALGRKAVALAPQSSEMAGYLGAIYAAINRYDDAILWYRRAIQLSPHERSWIESNIARMYLLTGRNPEARRCYAHVLESDPEYLSANIGMAIVALRLGDMNTARTHAERVMQIDPLFNVDRWARRYASIDPTVLDSLKADLRRLLLP